MIAKEFKFLLSCILQANFSRIFENGFGGDRMLINRQHRRYENCWDRSKLHSCRCAFIHMAWTASTYTFRENERKHCTDKVSSVITKTSVSMLVLFQLFNSAPFGQLCTKIGLIEKKPIIGEHSD